MIPVKVKDILPGLAEQIGIPEEDLANMLIFYYKENKRIASKLLVANIILRGLGTLHIKGWELEPRIKQNEGIIANSKRASTEDLKDELTLLYPALQRWRKEKEKKKEVGIKKKEYYTSKNLTNETQGDTQDSVGK